MCKLCYQLPNSLQGVLINFNLPTSSSSSSSLSSDFNYSLSPTSLHLHFLHERTLTLRSIALIMFRAGIILNLTFSSPFTELKFYLDPFHSVSVLLVFNKKANIHYQKEKYQVELLFLYKCLFFCSLMLFFKDFFVISVLLQENKIKCLHSCQYKFFSLN